MVTIEPVMQLANQYKDEFEEIKKQTLTLGDTISAKAQRYQQELNQMQPVINQQKDELISTLQDQSALSGIDNVKMTATFIWTGIMLSGMTVGLIVTKYALAPVLSLFISGFYATLAAYVVLPAMAFYYFTGPAEGDAKELDVYRRHCLLGIAIAELMAVTLGGALATDLAIGMATGLSAGFLLLAVLYTAVGYVVLQLYLKKGNGEAMTHIYQLAFLVAVVYSQGIVYSLLSVDASESTD
uniref:Membrane spanning protein n=1 Tax=Ascaris lumbricoides TaxID=6252 RepID=A0A0M3IDJ4_ASCLU